MSRETVGVPTLDPGMVSPYAEGWDTIEHQER
jgi:hypothetical protein